MNRDETKLLQYYSNPPEDISLESIDLNRLPSHITIIMDGNGRWAKSHGWDRTQGHKAGVSSLREAITACVRLGIDYVSAYAFSTENWNRPQYEVNMLMKLFAKTLVAELPLFEQENVRLQFLGDLEGLPEEVQKIFQVGLDATKDNTGMLLALAVNYGSRSEIVRATRMISEAVAEGKLNVDDIDSQLFSECLYTYNMPDPELLIRTSGELRLSNYLLWQLAYTEFYSTDVLWPDFNRFELLRAIAAYQGRDRRFGGVKS